MKKFQATLIINNVKQNVDIEGTDSVNALKKWAIAVTEKGSPNIEWINALTGNVQDVLQALNDVGYPILELAEYEDENADIINDDVTSAPEDPNIGCADKKPCDFRSKEGYCVAPDYCRHQIL